MDRKADLGGENKKTGNSFLVIHDIDTSCGCLTVDYTKQPIDPNGEAILKLNYKADYPEYIQKTIKVYCNVEDSPILVEVRGIAQK